MAKKHVFKPNQWKLATLQFSERWKDPKTGLEGSPFYIVSNSINAEATDGKSQLVILKGDTRSDDPNRLTIMLQVYGGKAMFEQLPKEAYINVDPAYEGARFLTVDDHDQLTASAPPVADSTQAEAVNA